MKDNELQFFRDYFGKFLEDYLDTIASDGWESTLVSRAIMQRSMFSYAERLGEDQKAIIEIRTFLDEWERRNADQEAFDLHQAEQRLWDIRSGRTTAIPLEEVMKRHGLEV